NEQNITPVFPGLYYEKIGTLNLYNDDWKVIIHLDLYDYYDEYELIHFYVHQIGLICFITSVSKRSLTDGVGSVSKTLFGTLDEDDAIHFNSQINTLKKNRNTKYIIEATNINSAKYEQYYFDHFDTKINRIVKYVNDLNENISNFEIKDHLTFEVNELVSIFNLILTIFKVNQNNSGEIMSFAQRGILHSLVITPMKFIHEASNIHNFISDLTFSVTPVIGNMHILFNYITTNIVFINKKLTFVLYITLIEKPDYDVSKMSSFPVPLTNNIFGFIFPQE
ncbi:LOW QUALITY PROTEIN: uncharacterized protein, partial [Leptinotarsa decemlineata]|uniref:LOW QUALITY PROTEIN: uncharacterized protein n=1 Tax=Leptinotarsa decemlineata TaxID=7539 RepID=UPI003D308F15